ncbi:MAG: hypothetical protein H0Z19_07410 [Archaeoglobus sp.]|uniref:hypothetical protein n=1 Tax=Archaeoglobus sp. TaxID=1872626 RepID=UPI001DEB50CE|nr:hypothetical protein [Archaeoglobus sp.]MBO8180292.1 hypothetical protein [Archaeoglobus sp.]
MARKAEYLDPRPITAVIEGAVKTEIDAVRGRQSWGKLIMSLWAVHKGDVADKMKLEQLEKENAELKKLVEEMRAQIEQLQARLDGESAYRVKKQKQIEAMRAEFADVLKPSERIKLVHFFRRLGIPPGDGMKYKAETLITNWFNEAEHNGERALISRDLGLIIYPDTQRGVLGWTISRLDRREYND